MNSHFNCSTLDRWDVDNSESPSFEAIADGEKIYVSDGLFTESDTELSIYITRAVELGGDFDITCNITIPDYTDVKEYVDLNFDVFVDFDGMIHNSNNTKQVGYIDFRYSIFKIGDAFSPSSIYLQNLFPASEGITIPTLPWTGNLRLARVGGTLTAYVDEAVLWTSTYDNSAVKAIDINPCWGTKAKNNFPITCPNMLLNDINIIDGSIPISSHFERIVTLPTTEDRVIDRKTGIAEINGFIYAVSKDAINDKIILEKWSLDQVLIATHDVQLNGFCGTHGDIFEYNGGLVAVSNIDSHDGDTYHNCGFDILTADNDLTSHTVVGGLSSGEGEMKDFSYAEIVGDTLYIVGSIGYPYPHQILMYRFNLLTNILSPVETIYLDTTGNIRAADNPSFLIDDGILYVMFGNSINQDDSDGIMMLHYSLVTRTIIKSAVILEGIESYSFVEKKMTKIGNLLYLSSIDWSPSYRIRMWSYNVVTNATIEIPTHTPEIPVSENSSYDAYYGALTTRKYGNNILMVYSVYVPDDDFEAPHNYFTIITPLGDLVYPSTPIFVSILSANFEVCEGIVASNGKFYYYSFPDYFVSYAPDLANYIPDTDTPSSFTGCVIYFMPL